MQIRYLKNLAEDLLKVLTKFQLDRLKNKFGPYKKQKQKQKPSRGFQGENVTKRFQKFSCKYF